MRLGRVHQLFKFGRQRTSDLVVKQVLGADDDKRVNACNKPDHYAHHFETVHSLLDRLENRPQYQSGCNVAPEHCHQREDPGRRRRSIHRLGDQLLHTVWKVGNDVGRLLSSEVIAGIPDHVLHMVGRTLGRASFRRSCRSSALPS